MSDYYESFDPPEPLRPYVQRFMVADVHEDLDLEAQPVPTGYNYLGWVFRGDPEYKIDGTIHTIERDRLHVSGQIQGASILARFKGKFGHVVAECTATGFYELTGVQGLDVLNHSGSINSLDDVSLGLFRDFCSAPSFDANGEIAEGRLAAFTEFLTALAQNPKPAPSYIANAAGIFEAAGGAIRIADVLAELRISQRQLHREFKRVVGVTPKYFCSALQLNTALQAMLTNDDVFLTNLACDAGYFDQSHFNAAMKRFVAHSPREFLDSETSLLASFLGQNRDRFAR